MNKVIVQDMFWQFISKITDQKLQQFTKWLFDKLPDYWFNKPASSTGKYHPAFAQGDGGLARHTLAMCKIWEILWRGFPSEWECDGKGGKVYFDCGIVACIFHDALKYGKEETFPNGFQYTTKGHEADAAEWICRKYDEWQNEQIDTAPAGALCFDEQNMKLATISSAIRYHMGPWSIDGAPRTYFEQMIFIADYMASSKWFEESVFQC